MIQSILTITLITVITILVKHFAKQKSMTVGLNAEGMKVLKCHIIYGILGYFCLLLLIFSVGIIYYFGWGSDPKLTDYIIACIMIGLIVYGAIYMISYYYNHSVAYDHYNIYVYNAWGKCKIVQWKDLKDVTVNTTMQEISLYTKDTVRVKMSMILYGLGDFKNEFAKHHPYMAVSLFSF